MQRAMRVYVLLACLACSCTRANVDFNGGNGGGGGNGGAGGIGGAGGVGGGGGAGGGNGGNGGVDAAVPLPDMAMSAAPDMARILPTQCTADQRQCVVMPTASEGCSGGYWSVDRACPYGSRTKQGASCSAGYCQPPQTNGTTGCSPTPGNGGPVDNICPGSVGKDFSCQPFITDPNNLDVEWWCAIAVDQGVGSAGDPCTQGSDCHSGICASNGTCFYGCQSTADCPLLKNNHITMACSDVTIHVEGQDIQTQSCSP
jgi:hypothetical protein